MADTSVESISSPRQLSSTAMHLRLHPRQLPQATSFPSPFTMPNTASACSSRSMPLRISSASRSAIRRAEESIRTASILFKPVWLYLPHNVQYAAVPRLKHGNHLILPFERLRRADY